MDAAGALLDIVLDVRCLQDPDYARRGIGRHALAVLRGARAERRLAGARLVGLADPLLPGLIGEAEAELDQVRTTAYTGALAQPTAFVALSPMTHDPLFVARLLHGPAPAKVAAVYDFIPLDAPERYLRDPGHRLDYETRLRWLRRYDLYLPISEATAARLRALPGLGAARLAVTGAPLDPAFERPENSPESSPENSLGSRPGPPAGRGRHVLVVGGEPRKNPECAVRAHARSRAMQAGGVPLVVVGQGDQALLQEQRRIAAELGGQPGLVQARAHVPEAELLRLYREALCVVAPSRDEGFSLPVVEAMASGAPVLASRIPAHQELLGDPAALFAPEDDERLAALLDQAAAPGWRAAQAAANAAVWPRFRAEAVAGRFWSAVADRIAEAPPAAPAVLRGAKPRLAVLSPLPPARSGVADYTAGMCAGLGRHADLHLFSETPGASPPPGAASAAPLSALPFLDPGYDRVIGVVGNSDHHLGTLRGLLRYGGAAICHDGRLLEVYWFCMGPERAARLAEAELGRSLAPGEMETWLSGAGPPGALLLLLGELAETAEPLMVHARSTAAEIRRRYGAEAVRLPFCLSRGFAPEALRPDARAAARAARRRGRAGPGRHPRLHGPDQGAGGRALDPGAAARLGRAGAAALRRRGRHGPHAAAAPRGRAGPAALR